MTEHRDPRLDLGVASLATSLLVDRVPLEIERSDDGVWRYAGTDVVVPGATDVTLADAVDIRVVSRSGGPPEAVLVERWQIDANPALEWVLEVGRLLRGNTDGDDLFEVPWPVWEERAAVPVDVQAPERDGRGIERILAVRERDLRIARHALELLAERRTRTIGIATGIGMSRRAIGELLGLSAGRVQQLLEEMPPRTRLEVDDFLRDAVVVLRAVGTRTVDPEDPGLCPGRGREFIDDLVAFGLLEPDPGQASALRVSEEGERAELHLRSAGKTGRSRRG